MSRPKITLRMNASENSLSIKEGESTTTIDRSHLSRPEQNKLRRMTVSAWRKLNEAV